MKHQIRLYSAIVITLCFLAFGCSKKNHITDSSVFSEPGAAQITLKAGPVGRLGKVFTVDLSNMIVALSADGEETINDTITVSGSGQQTVDRIYADLASLKNWTLNVHTVDQLDSVIHKGSVVFYVDAGQTVNVTLDLSSEFSTLLANYYPVRDSVTTCQLLIDGILQDEQTFTSQTLVGDTVQLGYDYLSTGNTHHIKLRAGGRMWGQDYTLYEGDTTITIISGEDATYNVILSWVGPTQPPAGQANMHVILGRVGEVVVNGQFEDFGGIATDFDGNIYNTVQIGSQVWMAENLRVTHFRNGESIVNVTDNSTWDNLTNSAFCYYNNNTGLGTDYGCLYNQYAVNDNRGLAPVGWHIPTDEEWKELEMFLGMSQEQADQIMVWRGTDEGGKLKEAGTEHWANPNTGATNESGFTCLPGGARAINGSFVVFGTYARLWTASNYDNDNAFGRRLRCDSSQILRYYYPQQYGLSVRCIKD